MVARIDDARVGQQVLPGRTDGGNACAGAFLATEDFVGGAGAQAPHVRGILDFHPVVHDVDIAGEAGLAFHDDGVPAGLFDACADHASAVGVYDEVALGEARQRGDGGAPCHGNTRGSEGPHGEHDLVFRGQGVGAGGNLVVHDLVGQTHAAHVGFVGLGGKGGDLTCGQVHAKDLAGPAV